MAGIDPRLLNLSAANRGGGGQSSRQRKSLATYQKFRETLGAKGSSNKFTTGNYIEDTIILDIGGRYSKVGFVKEPGPRRICKTLLRLGDERKSEPYSSQQFKACRVLKPVVLSLSKHTQSPSTWQEITELLVNDLLFTQLEIKPDKRRIIVLKDPWWPSSFQNALARSFFRHGCPGVHFVDAMHTALFVTGGQSGMVIDVGYHSTKIQASMYGHIIPETRDWRGVGFYSIMQKFKVLMRDLARLDFSKFAVDEGQIENAIARTCFVQPLKYKHQARAKPKAGDSPTAGGGGGGDHDDEPDPATGIAAIAEDQDDDKKDELSPNGVSYEFNVAKQSAFCKITPSIRRTVCEVLFDDDQKNIVHLLCDALLRAPIDCRGVLVNNVLLTGGTAQLAGFEARFIQEWHRAMQMRKYAALRPLRHRFRLLPCKFPANIRMFAGASIYGDLTSRFVEELFINKKTFEEKQNARLDDWTEHAVYPYSQTVKNLTHAQVIRIPQYKGRPTYNIQRRSIGIGNVNTSYKPMANARFGGGTHSSDSLHGSTRLGAPGGGNNGEASPIAEARRTVRFGAATNGLL